ncbi:MAG: hypothetical protein RIS21_795 [Planctomycetota bacterium]
MNPEAETRNGRRAYIGTVVSDKMDRTITVRVDRLVKHPVFGKYIRRRQQFKAHDEHEQAGIGDRVEIVECRPLSRTKRFRLVRIVEKARISASGG